MTQPTSISLVINLIRTMASKYKKMSFTYGYDQVSNQHVIDVTPKDLFLSDAYLLDEAIITKAFIESYPDETILFVSEDQYITIDKPVFITEAGNDLMVEVLSTQKN